MFRMDLSLDRIRAAVDAWRREEWPFGPPYALVHVLGTNGKGSTTAMIASLAACHGWAAGAYLSPHIVDVRERVRLYPTEAGGAFLPADDDAWLDAADFSESLSPSNLPSPLTYFERLTHMAAILLADEPVEVAVMEAGMGGRYDAVRAFSADLRVYAPISTDHAERLGPTLADIARDKAEAMRALDGSSGAPVVSATQPPEVEAILRETARAARADIFFVDELLTEPEPGVFAPGPLWPLAEFPDLTGLALAMSGRFERENFRLALAAWAVFLSRRGGMLDADGCRAAARMAWAPCRFQRVPAQGDRPGLILDAAHNPHGLAGLAEALREASISPVAVVFACLTEKDLPAMAPIVAGLTDGPIFVPELTGPAAGVRARPAAEVAAAVGPRAVVAADPLAALAQAEAVAMERGGPVVVCGSFALLSAVCAARPELLTPPAVGGPEFQGEPS